MVLEEQLNTRIVAPMQFLSLPIAFVLAVWLTRRFCDPRSRLYILDVPNERSLHTHPVPRSGGIALVVAILVGLGVLLLSIDLAAALLGIVLGLLFVAVFSFLDDRSHLPSPIRLSGHFAAAGVFLVSAGALRQLDLPGVVWQWPSAVGLTATLFFIAWMTNLYNFMDGMDGFAGGMAAFGFGGLGVLGLIGGDGAFAAVTLTVTAAACGFLVFNFPPARIFMGDVGSAGLGFLAAALSLWGAQRGLFPVWVAVLVFGPFVVDATVTLIRRLLRRERVWEAHRTHYYQRLVQLGWGHRRTVLWEYGLMVLSLVGALLAVQVGVVGQWAIIGFLAIIYVAAMRWVDRHAPMPGRAKKSATLRK